MVLNENFQRVNETIGNTSEQDLYEDLIIESIQIYGMEMIYIPREYVDEDSIFNEIRHSKMENKASIEMYLESVDGFMGDGPFIGSFGFNIEDQANFIVPKKRWEEETIEHTFLPERPREGDLVYFPMSNALLEVSFVDHDDPFYQLGKLYVYKITMNRFTYNNEEFNTGDENIDIDVDNFDAIEDFDKSDEVETSGDEIAEFDPENPFGNY